MNARPLQAIINSAKGLVKPIAEVAQSLRVLRAAGAKHHMLESCQWLLEKSVGASKKSDGHMERG